MGVKLCLSRERENRAKVLENRVLNRIFGPRREEVLGDWRRLHNEEINNLCASPNVVPMMKSRRML
jgi:hypothetical protein